MTTRVMLFTFTCRALRFGTRSRAGLRKRLVHRCQEGGSASSWGTMMPVDMPGSRVQLLPIITVAAV